MNKCKLCGAQIPDNSKFCNECGASQSDEKPKKKGKKLLIAFLVLIIIIALAVCGYFAYGYFSAEALKDSQNQAVKEMSSYDVSPYRSKQKKEIKSIIDEDTAKVKKATSKNDVKKISKSFDADVKKIKTNKQMTEDEFKDYKKAAISEMKTTDLFAYDAANKKKAQQIIDKYVGQANKAETRSKVKDVKEKFNAEMTSLLDSFTKPTTEGSASVEGWQQAKDVLESYLSSVGISKPTYVDPVTVDDTGYLFHGYEIGQASLTSVFWYYVTYDGDIVNNLNVSKLD